MLKNEFNYNENWNKREKSYPQYPTVKHRKRFIISAVKKYGDVNKEIFMFDYGCGTGDVLLKIKETFNLREEQLGGCDISEKSIDITKKKINSAYFYNQKFPELQKKCDIIICSEVIEHAKNYLQILNWVKNNLRPDGLLLLSTQAGKMRKIDAYSGHIQTFNIKKLNNELEEIGFNIQSARLWGFPFFTLQKYLTDFRFESIKNNYLEGELSLVKRMFFQFICIIYFIHDIIKLGPQIYIVAKNNK